MQHLVFVRVLITLILVFGMVTNGSEAQSAEIIPGPAIPLAPLGHTLRWSPVEITDTGIAVANLTTWYIDYDVSWPVGTRAFVWDLSGTHSKQLTDFDGNLDEFSFAIASGVNAAGAVVGQTQRLIAPNESPVRVPVVWEAGSGMPKELATSSDTAIGGYAADVSDSSQIVGYETHPESFPGDQGRLAVVWPSAETSAVQLEFPASSNNVESWAVSVGESGSVIGMVRKRSEDGTEMGNRVVRWDTSGTATELGHLGTSSSGRNPLYLSATSGSGFIVGGVWDYDEESHELLQGNVATRWSPNSSNAEPLADLTPNPSGDSNGTATDVNDSGMAVGFSIKFNPDGSHSGSKPVRWDIASDNAMELGHLSDDPNGQLSGGAFAINNFGQSVGALGAYDEEVGHFVRRAVYWDSDGNATDLNSLIDPTSGWFLNSAEKISDTGWILGEGTFDPDGVGGEDPTLRLFTLNVHLVPEPSASFSAIVGLLTLSCIALRRNTSL